MRKVKVKKEDGFLTVSDADTGEELLVTSSWFWFWMYWISNKWTLK